MKLVNPGILTINGGSSSIKFALYQTSKLLEKKIYGSIDRIGLPGTSLTFSDSTGKQKGSIIIESSNTRSAANFLIDWLERNIDFSLISGVGHRVVFGMKHTEPECITQELLDELHRISPYEMDHLPDEIDRVQSLGTRAAYFKQFLRDKLLDHKKYINKYGQDMPDIRNWKWCNPK